MRKRGFPFLALAAAALLAVCAPAALAKNRLVGKDGKIHACYRVKGKPKGALRVVRGIRPHCRRGERKVAWTVAGAVGPTGATGAQGTDGSSGVDTSLLEEVKLLTGRVEELESTLAGITNEDLLSAVNALPAVEAVCEQSEALTEQVNLVAEAVEGIGLNNTLKTLGGLLEIPPLPEELQTFSCPSF